MNGISEFIAAAKKLIDAVSYDVNGVNGRGGNGGLVSTETIRASDELRLVVHKVEKARLAS
jgi:hypothetical protein